jgi:hypothetical protein
MFESHFAYFRTASWRPYAEEAFALETQDGIGAIDGAAAETLVVALPAFVGPEKHE